MQYIYSATKDSVTKYLAHEIQTHLSRHENVLWLLSGGSNIATAVAVGRQLQGYDLSKLAVTLVDERFGPVGHADENWQQLLDAGFKLDGATLYRPLQRLNRADTTRAFGQWVAQYHAQANFSIGLFGIGTDGHTAGLKPGTPSIYADGWATDFSGPDYERFTITFDTIKLLDVIIVQAMGTDKIRSINKLQNQTLSLDIQPAQILKTVPNSILFTDNKEILS